METSGQPQVMENTPLADALNTDCTETTGIEPQVVKPKTAAQGESMSIKKHRGGYRPGGGRKPDLVKRMIGSLKPTTAREVLEIVPVEKVKSKGAV